MWVDGIRRHRAIGYQVSLCVSCRARITRHRGHDQRAPEHRKESPADCHGSEPLLVGFRYAASSGARARAMRETPDKEIAAHDRRGVTERQHRKFSAQFVGTSTSRVVTATLDL